MKRKCIEADRKLRKLQDVRLKVNEDVLSTIVLDASFITNTEISNELDGDESQQTSIILEVLDSEGLENVEKDLLQNDGNQNRKSLRLMPSTKRKLTESSVPSTNKKKKLSTPPKDLQPKKSKLENSLIVKSSPQKAEVLKEFICDLCKFSSKRKKNLERHIRAVHMKSFKFNCSFNDCVRKYTTQAALKLHCVRDHDVNAPFKCEKCNQKFSCESLFKIHSQRLTCRPRKNNIEGKKVFEKTLKCPHCEFITAHQFSLTQHVNLIHLNIRKTWKCEMKDCHMEFTNRTSLNQHTFSFHNLSHIRCPDCEQAFTNESQLQNHKESLKCHARKATDDDFEETSSGVKCKLCNRNYRSKKEWITHYFNHHKFNKVCDICNVQLSTYASLKNHKKTIHEKIKRFSCTECPKAFSAKHTLEFHLNTHSGKKPYNCKFCSFKASDRSSVSKHQKKLHVGMS